MRRRVRLLTSLAFGILAVLLAKAYADAACDKVKAERSEVLERYGGEVTSLIVARSNLAAGDVISESNVEVREWLSDLAPTGALTNIDEVVGVRLSAAVAKGEPLNELDIAQASGALDVPEGRVAISVSISDKTGIERDVAAGSSILVYRFEGSSLELLTSDALVISSGSSASSSSRERICLALLPSAVEDVLAANSDGSLRLALPGAGVDSSSVSTNSAPSSVGAAVSVGSESDALDGDAGGQSEDVSDDADTASSTPTDEEDDVSNVAAIGREQDE